VGMRVEVLCGEKGSCGVERGIGLVWEGWLDCYGEGRSGTDMRGFKPGVRRKVG
jgi:hypothetical protein